MTLLAHISDLHLIERGHDKRRGLARQRLAFLSAGVPLDAELRIRQAVSALQTALRMGAEHVVVTGDLTEDGDPAQFEVLAEVLSRSGIAPGDITLVPGNHDAYSERAAWGSALMGSLSAYRATCELGAHSLLTAAVVVPVSTAIEGQWFTRSSGQVRADDVMAIRRLSSSPALRDRAIVVVQHHPVTQRALLPLEWLDGAQNASSLRELLLERTRVHVLHGHVHRVQTRHLCGRNHAQVYAAAALRNHDGTKPVVRLYKAEAGRLYETEVAAPLMQPLAAARPAVLSTAYA